MNELDELARAARSTTAPRRYAQPPRRKGKTARVVTILMTLFGLFEQDFVIGLAVVLFAGAWFAAGAGLCLGKRWARHVAILLAIFSISTAVTTGYFVWALFHGPMGVYLVLNRDVVRIFR